jgi:AbrB family looped-hinge helix DNA binding protein
MDLHARVQIGDKGRILIPAEMREGLGIADGTTLLFRVEDNELRLSTFRSRIECAQAHVRKYIQPGVSLSDELSAERREAAGKE